MSESAGNVRRSTRISCVRHTSDDENCKTPKKNKQETPGGHRTRTTSSVENDADPSASYRHELEKELETIKEDVQIPKELFTEEDVSGNRYYGFQTPSKKNAMAQKAMLCRTPTAVRNPEKLPILKIIVENADIQTINRKSTKSQIEIMTRRKRSIQRLLSSESESVSEDSEYVPSGSDGSGDDSDVSEASEEENDDSEKESTACAGFRPKKIQIPVTPSARRGKSKNTITYSDFLPKTDEYFEKQSEKILTSDRTLARLKNPRLNEEKLQELLSNQSHISTTHTKAICRITKDHKSSFPIWYHIMEEGYSLLLHGLGSKRGLINDFHREIVADHPTMVVNGFFPSLTVKDILDSIVTELLGLDCPTSPNECFNLIEETLRENPDDRLYLMIHNIDGAMLRSNKAQDILSRLAAIPNVRLLASVDHINAPIIWDNVKRSRYNFYWWDATTLMPYEAETSYESSLLVQHSGALALSSLHNVFQSLTANTKAIYTLLVKHQLENGRNQNYPGMAFKDLYRGAREGFLVSSDLALRAQLTEFIDHKLVKTKRNMDGAEYLVIPLDNALLKQFLDQQDES